MSISDVRLSGNDDILLDEYPARWICLDPFRDEGFFPRMLNAGVARLSDIAAGVAGGLAEALAGFMTGFDEAGLDALDGVITGPQAPFAWTGSRASVKQLF